MKAPSTTARSPQLDSDDTRSDDPLLTLLDRPSPCRGYSGAFPCTCPSYHGPTSRSARKVSTLSRLTWSCDLCDHALALHCDPLVRTLDEVLVAEETGAELVERCKKQGCACPCFAKGRGRDSGEDCYLCGDQKEWHRPTARQWRRGTKGGDSSLAPTTASSLTESTRSLPRSSPDPRPDEAYYDFEEDDDEDVVDPLLLPPRRTSSPRSNGRARSPTSETDSPACSDSSALFGRSPTSTTWSSPTPASQALPRDASLDRPDPGPDPKRVGLVGPAKANARSREVKPDEKRISDLRGATEALEGMLSSQYDLRSAASSDHDDWDIGIYRTVEEDAEDDYDPFRADPPPRAPIDVAPTRERPLYSPAPQAIPARDRPFARYAAPPAPMGFESSSRVSTARPTSTATAESGTQTSEVYYPSGVSAGSSSSRKTIAVAMAPSPRGIFLRPGSTVNLVVFLPGKVTAENYTSIVVNVIGTSMVPGEPPDSHVFYFESKTVHPLFGPDEGMADNGVRKDWRSGGERWAMQITIPDRTNCGCRLPGQGVPVPDSSLDPSVHVKYVIEVRARRKEKLASNPKISIPIRVRRATRPGFQTQLALYATPTSHFCPDHNDIRLEKGWMVVEATQPVDGVNCFLAWRIEGDPDSPLNVVFRYRITLPISSDSILSPAAKAMLESTRVSVTRKMVVSRTGGRKSKPWVSPTVVVRVRNSERGEVETLPGGKGYAISGDLHIAKLDLHLIQICNAEISFGVSAQLTHTMFSRPLRAVSVLPTVLPSSSLDHEALGTTLITGGRGQPTSLVRPDDITSLVKKAKSVDGHEQHRESIIAGRHRTRSLGKKPEKHRVKAYDPSLLPEVPRLTPLGAGDLDDPIASLYRPLVVGRAPSSGSGPTHPYAMARGETTEGRSVANGQATSSRRYAATPDREAGPVSRRRDIDWSRVQTQRSVVR